MRKIPGPNIVLGIPRSGLTAVAGGLHYSGCRMFSAQNRKRVKRNDAAHLRTHWSDTCGRVIGRFEDPIILRYHYKYIDKAEAGDVYCSSPEYYSQLTKVAGLHRKSPAWGYKDCQFMKLYEELIVHVREPRLILVERDPENVRNSIQRWQNCSGWGAEFSYNTWNKLYQRIKQDERYPKIVVRYEDVIDDPQTQMTRLCEFAFEDPSKADISLGVQFILTTRNKHINKCRHFDDISDFCTSSLSIEGKETNNGYEPEGHQTQWEWI